MPRSRYFRSSSDFREWLGKNHARAAELWVGFYKVNSKKTGISYKEAVDHALCFGWIDGLTKRVDDTRWTIRFTPRRRGSVWSMVNIKRAKELSRLGLMKPPGLEAFRARDEHESRQYSYEARNRPLDAKYQRRLRQNKEAWDFYRNQPPSYRQAVSWWVTSAKKEETRLRRLAKLIEHSERAERIPALTSPSRRKPAPRHSET
ncbi:MAG: YdeI/OmpD-associated family protein [Actinomycetota bacterium]